MILDRVELENWGPFQGAFELPLQPLAYAVVAVRDGDPEASNYAGKSSLLEAIRFALFGTHRHQPSADGWITEGQKEGAVALRFDDGLVVERQRQPGKSTQLSVRLPGQATCSKQDEAQAVLLQRIGMSEQDLMTCCYLEQGAASRFVTEDPGPRTQMVVGWLRLEPLQRAHKAVGEEVAEVERSLADMRGRMAAAAERLKSAQGDEGPATAAQRAADLDQVEDELARAVVAAEAELEEATERTANAGIEALWDEKRKELTKLVWDGRALTAEHAAVDGGALQQALNEASVEWRCAVEDAAAVEKARQTKLVVARGEFDGRCPVADIECPARDRINGMVEEGKAALAGADEARRAAFARLAAAEARRTPLQQQVEDLQRLRDRLVEMGKRARELKASLEGAPETRVSGAGPNLLEAQQRCIQATRARDAHRARMDVIAREEDVWNRADDAAKALEGRLATLREAQAVLGRQGAQRRLAEGELAKIEGEANAVLAGCGIEISIRLSWEREGKAPADECDACGRAFPASVKVRECPECGRARGKNRVQRLDVELSRESGAAKDLGGVATALGAASWLRQARSSAWAVAMLDEVGAALDKRNRRALGGQLGAMLGLAGFRQSLVVSHDPQSVASLPGRILVTGDGRRSRVEVV